MCGIGQESNGKPSGSVASGADAGSPVSLGEINSCRLAFVSGAALWSTVSCKFRRFLGRASAAVLPAFAVDRRFAVGPVALQRQRKMAKRARAGDQLLAHTTTQTAFLSKFMSQTKQVQLAHVR